MNEQIASLPTPALETPEALAQAAAQQAVAQQAVVQQAQASQQSSASDVALGVGDAVAHIGVDIGVNVAIEGVALAVRSSASMVPQAGVEGFQTGGGVGGEAFQGAAIEAAESGAFDWAGTALSSTGEALSSLGSGAADVAGAVVEGTFTVIGGLLG